MADASTILRPEELNTKVDSYMKEAIDNLIAAIERDDKEIDLYWQHILAQARFMPQRWYDWISWYYVQGGWRRENARESQPD